MRGLMIQKKISVQYFSNILDKLVVETHKSAARVFKIPDEEQNWDFRLDLISYKKNQQPKISKNTLPCTHQLLRIKLQ